MRADLGARTTSSEQAHRKQTHCVAAAHQADEAVAAATAAAAARHEALAAAHAALAAEAGALRGKLREAEEAREGSTVRHGAGVGRNGVSVIDAAGQAAGGGGGGAGGVYGRARDGVVLVVRCGVGGSEQALDVGHLWSSPHREGRHAQLHRTWSSTWNFQPPTLHTRVRSCICPPPAMQSNHHIPIYHIFFFMSLKRAS